MMIKLTRINKIEKFWINEHLIEYMEETPDTILTMVSGRKYAVAETAAEITTLIFGARRAVLISRDEDGEIVV